MPMVRRMIKMPLPRFILPLLLALALPAAGIAQTQAEAFTGSLLPGWRLDDGHYMAALRLDLAPEWKTYWRAPGEAGIPPMFDWTGSVNVGAVAFHWPSPLVITQNGLQSIAYHDQLILPIEITPKDRNAPVNVTLHVQLGVCKAICLPATLDLTASLGGTGDPDPVIEAALRKGPISGDAVGLTKITCDLTPIADGMHLQANLTLPEFGAPETVVIETTDPSVWVATATAARKGGTLTAATDLVPAKGVPFALDRAGVTVTVIGQGRSVEIKGCPAP